MFKDHKTAQQILALEGKIQSGSKKEMLFNLVKSFNNDHFGWKKDKQGYYRELFLHPNQVRYMRKYLSVRKKKSDFPDLYVIRIDK